MKHIRRVAAVMAALAILAAPSAAASSDGSDDDVAIRPNGKSEAQSWVVNDGHHAFGIINNSAEDGPVRDRLPQGTELSSCLEHKIPGYEEPVGDYADIILEAWEITIPEHPEWGVVRLAAIATCAHFPGAEYGYPELDRATDGYQAVFGMPTGVHGFVLEGWTDSPDMQKFMEGYGLAPRLAEIKIEDPPGGLTWTAEVIEGEGEHSESILQGTFVKAQRTQSADGLLPNGSQYAQCVPVKQQGSYIEWPKGSDTFGLVDYQNSVRTGSTTVDANTYMCLGGAWTWSDSLAELIGPLRPATLVGSQPNDDDSANRQVFHRYRVDRQAAGDDGGEGS